MYVTCEIIKVIVYRKDICYIYFSGKLLFLEDVYMYCICIVVFCPVCKDGVTEEKKLTSDCTSLAKMQCRVIST